MATWDSGYLYKIDLPQPSSVDNGTSYGAINNPLTGSLLSPNVADVKSGVVYGYENSLTGTLVVPICNEPTATEYWS